MSSSSSSSSSSRIPLIPRSIAIAQSFSTTSSSPLALFFHQPPFDRLLPPLLGLACTWLTAKDLLTLFRVSRGFLSAHHHQHTSPPSSSSSTSSVSSWSWVHTAWSQARLCADINSRPLYGPPKGSRNCRFPGIDEDDQPSHLCRLILSATPQLRHLYLHLNTRKYPQQSSMPDVLDLVPHLLSVDVSCEATDCTDHVELWLPLPATLQRHPLLHSLRCYGGNGELDMSAADILAIASHPALCHIYIESAVFHYPEGDEERHDFEDIRFNSDRVEGEEEEEEERDEEGRPLPPCTRCSSAVSVTARLSLLQHFVECLMEGSTVESRGPKLRRTIADMRKLISQLKQQDKPTKKRRRDGSRDRVL